MRLVTSFRRVVGGPRVAARDPCLPKFGTTEGGAGEVESG